MKRARKIIKDQIDERILALEKQPFNSNELKAEINELKEVWNKIFPEEHFIKVFPTYSENYCPECGYPKFKFNHEDFHRCHGCDWTSE
jgi:hypothetical protein